MTVTAEHLAAHAVENLDTDVNPVSDAVLEALRSDDSPYAVRLPDCVQVDLTSDEDEEPSIHLWAWMGEPWSNFVKLTWWSHHSIYSPENGSGVDPVPAIGNVLHCINAQEYAEPALSDIDPFAFRIECRL